MANIILAKADKATNKPWGQVIETAVAKLRLRYRYAYAHDRASVVVILAELAAADGVRNIMAASDPSNKDRQANAANIIVQQLIFDEDTSNDESTLLPTAASATGYNSDSSGDTHRTSRRDRGATCD